MCERCHTRAALFAAARRWAGFAAAALIQRLLPCILASRRFLGGGGPAAEETPGGREKAAATTTTATTAAEKFEEGALGSAGHAGQVPKVQEPSVNLSKQLHARFQLGPARKSPVVAMVLGMAGSGKTTLMQRIAVHVHEKQIPSYIINLDPAVTSVPFGCNIDIRDTVNYKQVMKQYQLGPNGGIMTSLNLFATKFDQVISLVENKADTLQHVFVDTPGQIEIFTWSASGTIISDMFAYSYPSVLLYVIDTPRNTSPVTFMSNMLYACSIMYKFKLPFIIVLNKTDITSAEFALEWMTDYEKFQVCI